MLSPPNSWLGITHCVTDGGVTASQRHSVSNLPSWNSAWPALGGLLRALAGRLPALAAAGEPGEELAALGRALLGAAATLAGTSEQELPK